MASATANMTAIIDDIGNYTRSDITLYTPGGKVFNTTAPEVLRKMVLGSRTNPDAVQHHVQQQALLYT